MSAEKPTPAPSASSTLHLTSLLDLSARLTESDPVEMLNVAVLSIMGRLKIVRACVLFPDGGRYVALQRLCKGVAPFSVEAFPCNEIMDVAENDAMASLSDQGITRVVPLIANQQLIAVLCLGSPVIDVADEQSTRAYLELAGTIVGIAAHNMQMVASLVETKKELEARNLMVTTLFESARDFTGAKDLNELLRLLSYRLMGQLMVSTFALFVEQADPKDTSDAVTMYANRNDAVDLKELEDVIMEVSEPSRVEDLPRDSELRKRLESARAALITPVRIHGVKRGVLVTRGKLNARMFTDEEVAFLEAIGRTAITAIENERLMEKEREKERELEIAASIQRRLLPSKMPVLDLLDLSAGLVTSQSIGGDYFDVIQLDPDRTLVAIADVAGKGIPAALLMANVQAALNVLARSDLPLTELVTRINALVCENTEPEVFITMFVAVINTRTMGLEYVNAGHNPPILLHGDDVVMLTTGGVLTGVIPTPPPYQVGIGTLYADDILVLYTDGLTEARNHIGEFGVGSLVEATLASREADASGLVHNISEAVLKFRGKTEEDPVDDDTTIMVIKIRKAP